MSGHGSIARADAGTRHCLLGANCAAAAHDSAGRTPFERVRTPFASAPLCARKSAARPGARAMVRECASARWCVSA
eukprot:6209349-Pleurochrysis_carterae.AAC.1